MVKETWIEIDRKSATTLILNDEFVCRVTTGMPFTSNLLGTSNMNRMNSNGRY